MLQYTRIYFFAFLFISGTGTTLHAQSSEIDSLKTIFHQSKKDTSRISVLIQIGEKFRFSNVDSSDHYLQQASLLSQDLGEKYFELKVLNELAWNYYKKNDLKGAISKLNSANKSIRKLLTTANRRNQKRKFNDLLCQNIRYTGNAYRKNGDFISAIGIYEKGLDQSLKSDNYKQTSGFYNDLAQTFYMQGQYPVSLNYCLKGIAINEKNGDEQGTASSIGNAGIIFKEMGDYTKAIEYFKKALKLNEKLGNKESIAINLGNIGVGYGHLKEPLKSIDYYLQAMNLHLELQDEVGLLYNYNNLAIEYTKLKKYDIALEYFEKSLKILKKHPDDYTAMFTYTSVGSTYLDKGNYSKALEYLDKARILAEKVNAMDQMMDNYKMLTEYFTKTNNPQKAFEYYKLFIKYRDSILNEENMRKTIQMEANFEYRQKMAADSILNARANEVQNEKIARQNAELAANTAEMKTQESQQIILFGGLGLVFIFAIFMYNRFKLSQKQNAIIKRQKQQVEIQKKDIEYQKNLVDIKQKEVIDSINYAQRIQRAILTTGDEIKKHLPDSFLYYKPKDIVAGDFYFFEVNDSNIFIAAADCTGHGVPGALMSMVCSNALTRCVKEFRLTDPGKILDKTREIVLETFRKSGSEIKDGMDISLAVFKTIEIRQENRAKNISWSGANIALWYFENGQMKEIASDKQSIGQSYDPKPFRTHTIEISAGSTLYLFTDGYADQFGGPEGKKFKYSQLQKLLTENIGENPEVQYTKLDSTFNQWKGDLEQVDDVCIIGIRL